MSILGLGGPSNPEDEEMVERHARNLEETRERLAEKIDSLHLKAHIPDTPEDILAALGIDAKPKERWKCVDCHEWCLDELDEDKKDEDCFNPTRDDGKHNWEPA